MMNQYKSLRLCAKEIRLSLGLKQQELAKLAGVSEVDVDSVERRLPVQTSTKQKILRTLVKHETVNH